LIRGQVIVVRVYRWRQKGSIAGVLENVDGTKLLPFHNFSELRKAMSAVLVEDISRKGAGQQ